MRVLTFWEKIFGSGEREAIAALAGIAGAQG